MRAILLGLAVISAFASAQDRDRTFYLTHTATIQQFHEVANLIRDIPAIKQVSTDDNRRSLTVRATATQIGMAEWIFNELDIPSVQTSLPHEYRVPGSEDVVRLFYLPNASTVSTIQDLEDVVRTISSVPRTYPFITRKALVIRGTAAQIRLAEWLVKELEPKTSPSNAAYQVVPGDLPRDENSVRVLYLSHTGSVRDFEKVATQIRTAAKIARMFAYGDGRAVALRGTPDQVALAERLAKELDKP